MKKYKLWQRGALALALLAAGIHPAAHAEMSAAELDRLGRDLTPNGAERAGNKEGTIPEWTGGIRAPADWQPAQGYVDPFKDEKPLLRIDQKNLEGYKDRITPGMVAMLRKYPNLAMYVYPTHRSAFYPKEVYDATRAQAGKARLSGLAIENYEPPGTPFPLPRSGAELIYNHLTRYFGGYKACRDWLPVRSNGDFYRVGFCEDMIQGQNIEPRTPGEIFNIFAYYDAPDSLVGTIYLVRDPVDASKSGRQAWIYASGQRRVRRAPDLGYDNIDDGTEGMRTTDEYWGFQGPIDRYDWKLLGKREMFIPYNAYRLQDPRLKYKDMVDRGSIKSELLRYELHRVWVLEATLKPGMSHVVSRKTYYVDEDSTTISMAEGYDGRGSLWRVYAYPQFTAWDAGVQVQAPFLTHDLSNGNYMVTGLTNERPQPAYRWNQKGKAGDFTPDAVRRRGTR